MRAVTLSADVSNVEHVIVDGEFSKRDVRLLADLAKAISAVQDSRDYLVQAAAAAKSLAQAAVDAEALEEAEGAQLEGPVQ